MRWSIIDHTDWLGLPISDLGDLGDSLFHLLLRLVTVARDDLVFDVFILLVP